MLYNLDKTYFNTNVSLDFGDLGKILDWCKENCSDEWGYKVLYPAGQEQGQYEFLFSNQHDLINFILWQK